MTNNKLQMKRFIKICFSARGGSALGGLAFFLFCFLVPNARAAYLGADGDKIFLNTEGAEINAIEGEIKYDPNALKINSINEGVGLMSLWIKKPEVEKDLIRFSGVIIGGINTTSVPLFKIEGNKINNSDIILTPVKLKTLLNDGKGTETKNKISNIKLQMSNDAVQDIYPPEIFIPKIVQDQAVFGGKYFIVFAADDKGSGIDHFEVKEGIRNFSIEKSPCLLENQNLDEDILVRALDRAGNIREAKIEARNKKPEVKTGNAGRKNVIIIIVFVFFVFMALGLKKYLNHSKNKSRH